MQRFVAGSGTTINSSKTCTIRVLEYVSILHGFEGVDNPLQIVLYVRFTKGFQRCEEGVR